MNALDVICEKNKIFTVTEINNIIRHLFKQNFGKNIEIIGEITNLRLSKNNLYFTLKDNNSMINAVIWNFSNRKTKIDVKNGDKIIMKGIITLYNKMGYYQINGNKIKLAGLGDLYKDYLEIKNKYELLGYFDQEKKKSLPIFIKNIGIATAIDGAALKDILYVLQKENFKGTVYIANCIVQGKDCPMSVKKAIKKLDSMNLDVIIISRGGGSYEDLFGFSNPIVIETIHNTKTCTISAIGHEIDYMLSDFVADIRAPTPSIAGEMICNYQNKNSSLVQLEELKKNLYLKIIKKIQEYRNEINEIEKNIPTDKFLTKTHIDNINNQILILKVLMKEKLSFYKNICNELNNKLEMLDPSHILEKGYCLIFYNNKPIMTLKEFKLVCKQSKKLKIKFQDGMIDINVVINE